MDTQTNKMLIQLLNIDVQVWTCYRLQSLPICSKINTKILKSGILTSSLTGPSVFEDFLQYRCMSKAFENLAVAGRGLLRQAIDRTGNIRQ
jgi:hypothetical protein